MIVNLSQFTSLFEIGFALHFAVAFLDRIYARELPVRIERINAFAKAIERFKKELNERLKHQTESDETNELRIGYKVIANPVWVKHNDQLVDRLYALRVDVNGQMKALQRILKVITFLSILVVLYSVSILFMIGLDMEMLRDLSPMKASVIVLMQLLPLPLAASIFFFVARRMSNEADRKIRGVGELNLMLTNPDEKGTQRFASVEQVLQRDKSRNSFVD